MDITIDNEFRDLIAPLTEEEYSSLENNILEYGFNPAYPLIVWKDYNIIVDGHNRFGICQKHGIEFVVIEQEFDSREAVIDWMVDNQLSRRNIDPNTRAYLIGKKYNVEKNKWGGSRGNSCTLKTDEKLAAEFNTSPRTVKNDLAYYKSVEKVCETGEISRDELMNKATMKDVNALAKLNDDERQEAIDKLKNGEAVNRRVEGIFPIYLKLDKETNTRLKSMAGTESTSIHL